MFRAQLAATILALRVNAPNATLTRCELRSAPSATCLPLVQSAVRSLKQADSPAHRLNELGGIVPDPLLEHHLDVTDVADAGRWVAVDHHDVRILADRDRAGAIRAAEER